MPHTTRREVKYQLRTQHQGKMWWTCPFCGQLNLHRLTRDTWLLQCGASICLKRYAHGDVFWTLPDGRRLPPVDITIPDDKRLIEALRPADLRIGEWRSGDLVNILGFIPQSVFAEED